MNFVSGFHFTLANFTAQTFEQDEVLQKIPGKYEYSPDNYTIDTINNIFLGRCFMICHKIKVKKNERITLSFSKNLDLLGYNSLS